MIHNIDIHNFLEKRKQFDRDRKKDINEETDIDRLIIMHIGLVSAVICLILQLITVFIGTVFYDQDDTMLLSILSLLFFQCFKYVLGGFGGNGNTINTIKFLLGLFSIWFYANFPTFAELAFDWFNGSIISKIEVWGFLLICGLLLGSSLATYVKFTVQETSLVYNRFVAGFNAGLAIGVSILLLLCSYR